MCVFINGRWRCIHVVVVCQSTVSSLWHEQWQSAVTPNSDSRGVTKRWQSARIPQSRRSFPENRAALALRPKPLINHCRSVRDPRSSTLQGCIRRCWSVEVSRPMIAVLGVGVEMSRMMVALCDVGAEMLSQSGVAAVFDVGCRISVIVSTRHLQVHGQERKTIIWPTKECDLQHWMAFCPEKVVLLAPWNFNPIWNFMYSRKECS